MPKHFPPGSGNLPFGKFQVETARRIIREYPRLARFFLDCFRHFEIDFAHDDGVTVANNRPAYSINFSYDDIETAIETMLKNMATFANKPQTIRTMRWVDGMMLEGDGDRMEGKYFYSCLAKPIIFLWTSNAVSDDENLRRAVILGCYPRVVDDLWGANHLSGHDEGVGGSTAAVTDLSKSKTVARRKKYMPLYDAFRGRVFYFEPDPMRMPKGCRGRLFTVGEKGR
ncbi:MAG: hypothetical protein ABIF71_08855 [Planctomycetota bacterium]